MARSQASPPISHQDSPGAATNLELTDEVMSNLSTTSTESKKGEQEDSQAETIADKASSSDHEKPEAALEVPFPFMKLPLEIRSMIYENVLRQPTNIKVEGRFGTFLSGIDYYAINDVATHCRIFLVSKAFYQEAMPIYFCCNTFSFAYTWVMYYVTRKLKVDYRRHFRSIKITGAWMGLHCRGAAKFLQGCVSLRHLSIRFDNSIFRWVRVPGQKRVFKPWGVGELLKVRGIRDLEVKIPHVVDFREEYETFIERLDVLKQPYSVAALRQQDKIDYPPKKAQRSVFGKANVVTRSERKMIANDQKD
ncbi:MAG: hypothetical protein LQ350_002271 [Teloschistes chrysophthalmus]|nr:MAG: hypothetical protein LQ350_002271 [Niorma chrysophthalma]